jgi:hypothetical protein
MTLAANAIEYGEKGRLCPCGMPWKVMLSLAGLGWMVRAVRSIIRAWLTPNCQQSFNNAIDPEAEERFGVSSLKLYR